LQEEIFELVAVQGSLPSGFLAAGIAEIEVGHRAGGNQSSADGEAEHAAHEAQQIVRGSRGQFHIRVTAQCHPSITPAKAIAERPRCASGRLLAQVQTCAIGEQNGNALVVRSLDLQCGEPVPRHSPPIGCS
jgi:hypothetical protein